MSLGWGADEEIKNAPDKRGGKEEFEDSPNKCETLNSVPNTEERDRMGSYGWAS